MASHVKNAVRYQPADWFTSNYTISTNAERQREASFQTRQEARFLSNETDSKTKWDQYDNNTRLADRVDEIRKWKEILEKSLADLDKEVKNNIGFPSRLTSYVICCECFCWNYQSKV